MPIKTLGSLGKIRVGRVTGNTHIFFFGLTVSFLDSMIPVVSMSEISRSLTVYVTEQAGLSLV